MLTQIIGNELRMMQVLLSWFSAFIYEVCHSECLVVPGVLTIILMILEEVKHEPVETLECQIVLLF